VSPPAADFSLTIDSPTVTLQQQGVYQYQAIEANAVNGFSGAITLAFSGLPPGVATIPAGPFSFVGVSQTQPQEVSFQLSASTMAPATTSTVTVIGTSGSISHSVTLSLTVTPVAPFTVIASPASVSVVPASSTTVQLSVVVNSGPAPQLLINVSDLPTNSGSATFGPGGFLTPGNPLSFTVQASVLAQPLQNFPILVTASDNTDTYVVVVPLTVSTPALTGAPTRSTYARTEADPTSVVYDETRKLVFAAVETLNEVVVVSSTDGHQMAVIPVEYPFTIDESADGNAVYVGSPYSPYVTTIDPNQLEVIQQTTIPQVGTGGTPNQPAYTRQLIALSNGYVLLFVSSTTDGSHLYLWTPSTNAFAQLGGSSITFQTQVMTASADKTTVLLYGTDSSGASGRLYSAVTGSFTGPVKIASSDYLAVSPDGSQIVAEGDSGQPTTFYDNQFNLLGSVSLSLFPTTGIIYGLDGLHVYAFGSATVAAVAVVNTQNFSLTGIVPDFQFNDGLPSAPLAIDETGMIFACDSQLGTAAGIEFLDAGSPGFFDLPIVLGNTLQPELLNLKIATPTQLNGAGFSSNSSYQVFFGPPPASPNTLMGTDISVQSNTALNVTAPPSTTAGATNVTITRSDGFFEVMPLAASYGPEILYISPNAGSPAGGDQIQIFGFGFGTGQLQVTVGGSSATVGQVTIPQEGTGVPLESINVTTPSGNPGIADVTVSNPVSSTTVKGGFQYLESVQINPIAGALDALVYDQSRKRLYISNEDHNRVEIFDLGTNAFLSPVPVGSQPAALALSPDNTELAVLNTGAGTVSVINPSTMKVTATEPVLTASDTNKQGCAGAPLNLVPGYLASAPHLMLVDVDCTAALAGGTFHILNVDTGSLSCVGVAGCTSDGTDLAFDSGLAAMASTPDGTKIFLGDSSMIEGEPVGLLDFTANTLTTGFTGTFLDAATDMDANTFAAAFAMSNVQLLRTGIMNDLSILNAGAQSVHYVIGEKLNPSGSLLFAPQDSGVDIFDVHRGRLTMHVAMPESIPLDSNAMALDETGTKMFLISNSGITIAQLFKAPLSLANVNPAMGAPGTQVTIRGSGFLNGATVTLGTTQETATFVDSNTLQVTVPQIANGTVRVTVTNPGDQQYSFDDAFTVN